MNKLLTCLVLTILTPLLTAVVVSIYRIKNTRPGISGCLVNFVKEKPPGLFNGVGNLYVFPNGEAHIEYNTGDLTHWAKYQYGTSQGCWMGRDVISTVHCAALYYLN